MQLTKQLRIRICEWIEGTLHSSPMISISKPLLDHDVQMIEKMKKGRFITTPHVWYRRSDLQKRARVRSRSARFFFPKMQIMPRRSGRSRCRAGINWEEWTGDGDDIQIRAPRKWQKYTYDTHPSYITRNWLVFRYRGIEFRLHPAPSQGAFACESRKTPVSIIQTSVIICRTTRNDWSTTDNRLFRPRILQIEHATSALTKIAHNQPDSTAYRDIFVTVCRASLEVL